MCGTPITLYTHTPASHIQSYISSRHTYTSFPTPLHSVRLSLASSVKEVRAGALRVLRYLLTSKDVFAVMLKHRIDLFVARSLDVPADREIERLQAMRFVRQVSQCQLN